MDCVVANCVYVKLSNENIEKAKTVILNRANWIGNDGSTRLCDYVGNRNFIYAVLDELITNKQFVFTIRRNLNKTGFYFTCKKRFKL